MAQVFPMWKAAWSRASTFRWYRVALKFPARSRSGLRSDDGMVVFAMPAAAVRHDDWGYVCPLWPAADRAGDNETGFAISEELLTHCRLAVRHGTAEGFLEHGEAALPQLPDLVALQVVKIGNQYWAKWGAAARAELPLGRAPAANADLR